MTTHVRKIRVYHEDTDLAGIVYYANYFKFIERARSDFLKEAGVNQLALLKKGFFFVVRRVEANFFKPAKFSELLLVKTDLKNISGAVIDLRQSVQTKSYLLFDAEVKLAFIKNGSPARVPELLKKKITSQQNVK
ncbi:MAG: YbgC/FadM family acyl-CoA thioesterase [Pseudomonadota bacterium]|nr:YbgC/FadM family acyl-CoA thioesterase [Pseudomonadota bacterium]